jgi:5-methylcytosine-specific restriction endonuclease McrA
MGKLCTKCQIVKPATLEYFHKHSKLADGLAVWCKQCVKSKDRNNYINNYSSIKEQSISFYRNNTDSILAVQKIYKDTIREEIKEKGRSYWAKVKVKASTKLKAKRVESSAVKERERAWRESNRGKVRKYYAIARALRKQALPVWTSLEDKELIELVYAEGLHRGLEVDHIVPLRGKSVCGLHVYWNLQLLDKGSNSRKSNKWPYESKAPL